eukprot:6125401-Prymnesium_polylepis.1
MIYWHAVCGVRLAVAARTYLLTETFSLCSSRRPLSRVSHNAAYGTINAHGGTCLTAVPEAVNCACTSRVAAGPADRRERRRAGAQAELQRRQRV